MTGPPGWGMMHTDVIAVIRPRPYVARSHADPILIFPATTAVGRTSCHRSEGEVELTVAYSQEERGYLASREVEARV